MIKIFLKIYLKFFGRYKLRFLLCKELEGMNSVLDVGCGRCSILYRVKEIIKKRGYWVGLDFYEPYIIESRNLFIHDHYVLGDARNLPFPSKSFDCVVASEIIEHLEKQDGLKMLQEMERVARQKIILTTPNGFWPTYAGPKDNPKEKHISGWRKNDFQKYGFKVYGLNGYKNLWTIKSGQAVPRINIPFFSSFLIDLSELIVYYYPNKAFQIFAIKYLNDELNEFS